MKILFAGPTIVRLPAPDGIALRGPAAQGDITAATLEGATAIGLIDGRFDDVASVWHKEILFALSNGVHVCGAASMGALRAAECDAFGMMGIGTIYRRYASGDLDDDAAVAHLHAPGELGYFSITEPLVNVQATIAKLHAQGSIDTPEMELLLNASAELHFKDRTYPRILNRVRNVRRRSAIAAAITKGKVDLKERDASELIAHLLSASDTLQDPPCWSLATTIHLKQTLERSA